MSSKSKSKENIHKKIIHNYIEEIVNQYLSKTSPENKKLKLNMREVKTEIFKSSEEKNELKL